MAQKKVLPMEQIIKEIEGGEPLNKLAEKHGIAHSTMRYKVNRWYESRGKEKPKRGNNLPIQDIIAKCEVGMTLDEIAKEYKVSVNSIKNIINEKYKQNKERKKRTVRSTAIIMEYLNKGLTPKEIQEIAIKNNVTISEDIMQKAIKKFQKGQER